MAFNVSIYSFTDKGRKLAEKIVSLTDYKFRNESIKFNIEYDANLTQERFTAVDAHVFVGACGIAVRKIAPFIDSKLTDPAVVVVDEAGDFVIPILSGHIGGANDLSGLIASVTEGQTVITTATDVNGYKAIDVLAVENGLSIVNKDSIKAVNAKILKGKTVSVFHDEFMEAVFLENAQGDLAGNSEILQSEENESRKRILAENNKSRKNTLFRRAVSEENADVIITVSPDRVTDEANDEALILYNRRIIAGIGCRKNTDVKVFEDTVARVLKENGLRISDVEIIASINLKSDEYAINEFCNKHDIRFVTYTADELNSVSGEFDESDFVKNVTGVSNVSERAAVKACEATCREGRFIVKRLAENGITVSLFETHKKIVM